LRVNIYSCLGEITEKLKIEEVFQLSIIAPKWFDRLSLMKTFFDQVCDSPKVSTRLVLFREITVEKKYGKRDCGEWNASIHQVEHMRKKNMFT